MNQNMLNLVCLLNLDADSDTVYARFDEYPLVFVSRNSYWVEEDFGRGLRFDFRDIVSFGGL